MKKLDGEIDFSAVYPLSRAEIEDLPLADAEGELLDAIVAAAPESVPGRGWSPSGRKRRLTGYAAGLAFVATAAVALLVIAGGTSTGGGGTPPAFGAGLVRVAKTSPLVLLDAPGWHVEDLADVTPSRGEMRFTHGVEAAGDPRHRAELRWHAGRVTPRMLASLGPALETTAPVLDTRVLALHSSGGPEHRHMVAIWQDAGRVMTFRSTVPDLATFRERLGALRRVGPTHWLRSLPRKLTQGAGAYKTWTLVPAR
jgi:hypothetical protein